MTLLFNIAITALVVGALGGLLGILVENEYIVVGAVIICGASILSMIIVGLIYLWSN